MVFQKGMDGLYRVIEMGSYAWSKTSQRWSVPEKELFALHTFVKKSTSAYELAP